MTEPVFMLAPPRSFTSLACAMIGNHPDLIGLAETNLFAADTYDELSQIYNVRPSFEHGLLRSIAELGLGGQTETNIEAARAWLDEQRLGSTSMLFRDLVEWAEPRGIVDKSPLHVFSPGALDRIRRSFPGARYLHLTREPRATCKSIIESREKVGSGSRIMDRGVTHPWDQEDIETRAAPSPEGMWLKPHLRILEMLEDISADRQMRIRGEDLLSAPETYLPQIAEWLDVRTDKKAIDAMMRPEESPFARPGPNNARLGNDPKFMKEPILRKFTPPEVDLDSPMSWDDSAVFDEVVKHYAMYFGY
jgi:hypothetical protein